MWHQLWSSSSVARTRSDAAAPGERSETVTSATCAPASCADVIARFVAQVAPSCEIAINKPPAWGSSAASNAWTAISAGSGASSPSAARTISAKPRAPCSLVPQPVTTIGAPAFAVLRMRSASRAAGPAGSANRLSRRSAIAGSAAIISVMR